MKDSIRPLNLIVQGYADKYYAHEKGFCSLCGNSGIINTTDTAFTYGGLSVGGEHYCICMSGQQKRQAYAPDKDDDSFDCWWLGFNLPLKQMGDEFFCEEPDNVPFEYWNTGWGNDYGTYTALIYDDQADTAEKAMEFLEKYFTIRNWRWYPIAKNSEEVSSRFPRSEKFIRNKKKEGKQDGETEEKVE